MKWIALILVFYTSTISQYRLVYQSQDEGKVTAMLKVLESKTSLTSDELCYKAVFQCMKAEYLYNPYQKLNSFKKGYSTLNNLISKNANNVEYKYHRYMIEKHTPSWLLDNNHMTSDKAFVKANLKTNHPMYSFITKTID
ncbi:MAG TPA: hypothetical protein DEQ56_09980 [Bacteroidetes bacterium]|jgi:hypothetical protein|nr:hypothetical protein [Bacteroidota bacterium]